VKYVKRRVIEWYYPPMFSYVIGQRGSILFENRIPETVYKIYITEISAYRQAYIPTTRTNIHVVDKPI